MPGRPSFWAPWPAVLGNSDRHGVLIRWELVLRLDGTPTERALHSRDRRAAECPGMRGQNQAFAFFSRSIYHAIHLQSYQYNQYCTRRPGVPAMPESKPEWKPDHEWVPEPSPRSTWTRRPPVASPGEQPAINFDRISSLEKIPDKCATWRPTGYPKPSSSS
jgi:hypothetical protein